LLDDPPLGHDDHAVGDRPDERKVVGDEQQTESDLATQPSEQFDDRCVNGDVEGPT
jgi:hypothetical protein